MNIVKNGVKFDSIEEYYFYCWCVEAKEAGFIESVTRVTEAMPITSGLINKYIETVELKTKTKLLEKKQNILTPSIYTPDFYINWSHKANDVFFQTLNSGKKVTLPFIGQENMTGFYSHVECKPVFDQNNMGRLFVINQKIIWDKYNQYINLIYPTLLFRDTFAPSEYMKTPTGKDRKFSYKLNTIKEFLDGKIGKNTKNIS